MTTKHNDRYHPAPSGSQTDMPIMWDFWKARKNLKAMGVREVTLSAGDCFRLLQEIADLSSTSEINRLKFQIIINDRDVERLKQKIESFTIYGLKIKMEGRKGSGSARQ